MKLLSPCLDLEATASPELLAESTPRLKGQVDPFIILEQSELTYMQCLWTEDGYDLEYQENSIFNHFRGTVLLSEEDIISAMQEYLSGKPDMP